MIFTLLILVFSRDLKKRRELKDMVLTFCRLKMWIRRGKRTAAPAASRMAGFKKLNINYVSVSYPGNFTLNAFQNKDKYKQSPKNIG
jgi:hypothetical protein